MQGMEESLCDQRGGRGGCDQRGGGVECVCEQKKGPVFDYSTVLSTVVIIIRHSLFH